MFSFREKHRQAVREKIFHPEWLQIIEKNVPYFRLLTPDEQRELQGLILVFLDEKSFEGCGGLEITGLKAAAYKLSIDDRQIGSYSQTKLAAGINLGFVQCGLIYKHGQELPAVVKEKNDTFFNRWRNVGIGVPLPPCTSAADRRKAEMFHLDEVKPELARLDALIAGQERVMPAGRPSLQIRADDRCR